jgi:hypothetical protein
VTLWNAFLQQYISTAGEKASVHWDSVLGEEYLVFVHGADYGVSANIGSFGLEVSEFVPEVNDLFATQCSTRLPLMQTSPYAHQRVLTRRILIPSYRSTKGRVGTCLV